MPLSRLLVLLAFVFLAAPRAGLAQRMSPLADKPVWESLARYHETITREEFERLLSEVYAPGDAARDLIAVEPDAAVIKTSLTPPTEFRLRFAKDAAAARSVPRSWKPAAQFGPAPAGKPLAGVKIALDPGHIGGAWARMEERYFRIGDTAPVTEGDMTLRVAELLAPQLEAMGAQVTLLRKKPEPTTAARPATLRDTAVAELARMGIAQPRETYDPEQISDPTRGETVQWQSEILFYRISEIRHRARMVNEVIKPDLVLCLHFNAEGWGDDAKNPQFVPRNHLHLLINGCYSAGELRMDDLRFEMVRKLLSRTFPEENAASVSVADALAVATQLPPFQYPGTNARRIGPNPYLWVRNLLANRLYLPPVLFLEPYVMNSQEVWERVQAGDFEGEKMVGGTLRKSIYREYADAVAAGLRNYYTQQRQ